MWSQVLLFRQEIQAWDTANLPMLCPLATCALQDITVAPLDQVSAPRQYVQPDLTRMLAGILASSAAVENSIPTLEALRLLPVVIALQAVGVRHPD